MVNYGRGDVTRGQIEESVAPGHKRLYLTRASRECETLEKKGHVKQCNWEDLGTFRRSADHVIATLLCSVLLILSLGGRGSFL